MKWNIIRNKDYYSRDTYHKCKCPKYGETATISIELCGTKQSKNDCGLTPSPHIKECSLLKKCGEKNITCIECPCFEEYKNSHSY